MVTKEEWIRKADAVGRFDRGAAGSEWSAYEGMPHLANALGCFDNFDANHRKGILDIITRWANYESVGLRHLVSKMREAHSKAQNERMAGKGK